MRQARGLIIFGLIEIAVGIITLITVSVSLVLEKSAKPPEVLVFVLTTACISSSLGIGILKKSLTSYHLLLFFSTVIIFSKLLIFTKIITLNGALETVVSQPSKNIISVVYHSLLVWYFSRASVRKAFGEKR